MLFALLKADARNAWARVRYAPRDERMRGWLFLGLLVAFVVAAEYLSYRLFGAFQSVGGVAFEFIAIVLTLRVLALLYLIVMGLLFFASLIASIDALYFDEDIDFLASHPVRRSALLAKKYVHVYLTGAWVVFLVMLPVMAGYGRALGHGFAHLPLSALSLFLFSLAPVAWGATAVILLMRWMPVDRAKEAVLAFAAMLSFAVIYLYRLLSPARLFQPERLLTDAADYVRELTLPLSGELPSSLMAQALVAAAPLKYGPWALRSASLLVVAAVSIGAYFLAGALAFATDRPVSGNAARPGPIERFFLLDSATRVAARLASPGARSLVFKEVMTHVRDPMQISHIMLMAGIVALHFANLTEIPYGIHPAARILVAFLNLGLVGFLSAGVAVRFVYPAPSLEGETFWILSAAPLEARRLLRVKFLVAWIPLALAALVVVTVSNRVIGIPASLVAVWAAAGAAIATAVTALALAVGFAMPVFNRKNVFEISSSPGGIVFMLMALLFVGGCIAALVPPAYEAALGASPALSARTFLALGIVIAASAAVTAASFATAAESLESFAERRYGIREE